MTAFGKRRMAITVASLFSFSAQNIILGGEAPKELLYLLVKKQRRREQSSGGGEGT